MDERRAICGLSALRLAVVVLGSLAGMAALAQAERQAERGQDVGDLAKAAQNPIADMISLPFQNNFNFNVGPHKQLQNILNIQPVVPISLNQDWNLITRWIAPVIAQPPLTITGDREFGLGDINPSFFFSPKQPTHGIIWGVGPTFVFPTGTNKTLTQGKYSMGPTFVALTIQGPWVVGALVNNVWSFTGKSNRPDVNQMLLQPFVNYNFPGGWYLTSSPIITANWEGGHGDR
ncbi:neuromedin U [Microvirga massiliensis]|uniref:neuromedin U n=1 Tax=Microvirga massiliensis TaxID=1033741 RepID=UPI000A4DA838|nr:neuromedin U [Microvirga massiliensis]